MAQLFDGRNVISELSRISYTRHDNRLKVYVCFFNMFLLYFIGGWSRSACLICSSRRSLISIPPHSANQLTKKLPCLSWLLLSPICSRTISPLNGRLSGVTPTHQPHTLPQKNPPLSSFCPLNPSSIVGRCPVISGFVEWWMGSDSGGGVCWHSSGTRTLFFWRMSVYTEAEGGSLGITAAWDHPYVVTL